MVFLLEKKKKKGLAFTTWNGRNRSFLNSHVDGCAGVHSHSLLCRLQVMLQVFKTESPEMLPWEKFLIKNLREW